DVYETLAGVVLPELRPEEIFLYPRPLHDGQVQKPRSTGKLLVDWAVRADRAAAARQRVESRQKEAMAELNAHILLAQLGLAAKDLKLLQAQLDWLGQRLQKDNLQNTAELACHVALPALYTRETAKTALPLVE